MLNNIKRNSVVYCTDNQCILGTMCWKYIFRNVTKRKMFSAGLCYQIYVIRM